MTDLVHYSPAGSGEELFTLDATVTVRIDAKHTGSAFELFQVVAARGPAAPPRREPWAKAFYVLQGQLAILVDMSARHGVTLAPPVS
jgi:quercetin dioxygenase-like cupin family protein